MPPAFCFCLFLISTLHFFLVPLQNITMLVYPTENTTVTCSTCTLKDDPEKKPIRRNYSAISEWKLYTLQCQQKLCKLVCPSYFSKIGPALQRLRPVVGSWVYCLKPILFVLFSGICVKVNTTSS